MKRKYTKDGSRDKQPERTLDSIQSCRDMMLNWKETQDLEKFEVINATFASVFIKDFAVRDPRPQRQGGKSGARKMCYWWMKIRSENT